MCTTIAKRINRGWVLGKTRDPVSWMRYEDECKLFDSPSDKFQKLIIQNPIPYEDGYYGGINERGVSFVATFVRTSEDQVSYIRKPYVRLILDAATAREAIAIIKGFNPKIGGNFFVADRDECFGIEATVKEYYVEEIKEMGVKTNHFLHLRDRNINFDNNPSFEPWSKAHQKRAEELLKGAETVEAMIEILKDRKNCENKCAIATTPDEAKVYTYSAFVFETDKGRAHYVQGCPSEVEWEIIDFSTQRDNNMTQQIDKEKL